MKGLFIPEITAEMFRNGCLESIETLMAEGGIYDIDYEPDVPDINVGDLISRQAAIDELEYAAWGKEWDKDLAKAMLESLPSAQPNTDEWCTDCKEYDREKHCCPRFNRVIRNTVEELKEAQTEIIRCKDCKHSFLHDNGERISRICGLTRMCGTTPDNWFCADAERREE